MGKIVQIARFSADGTQVTRTFKDMGDAGEQMTQRVKRGADALSPSLRAIDASAGVARQKIEGLAGSAGSLGTVLRSLGPVGLAAAAGIGAVVLAFNALQGATREAVRELGEIDVAAQRLGVSTDTLQEVRFAILGIGGAAEQADQALTQFSEKLGEATLTRAGGGFNALRAIGFTEEDIANMRSVEEALPRIAERIGGMASATEQMRVAKELGLDPLLPLLQQGEEAFANAAEEARRLGFVIDADLLTRAREMNGEWQAASRIIDLQLKSALVDLAPEFIRLAQAIADATRGLVEFLDRFKEVEDRADASLREQTQRAFRELSALRRTHNLENDAEGRLILDGLAPSTRRSIERTQERLFELQAELARRTRGRAGPALSAPTTIPTVIGSGAPDDAELRAHQQFVEQLREEIRVREGLEDVKARFPSLSDEEARARFALEEQIRRLEEARRAGAITSDAELEQLRQAAEEHYNAAAAARQHARDLQELQRRQAERDSFLRSIETPEQRIVREIEAIREMERRGDITAEQAARGVARLGEEWRDLAAAQYEASLQGRILGEVLDGQIRNIDDLKRVLLELLLDPVIAELRAGTLFREGLGGFASAVGGRLGGMIGIGGDGGGKELTAVAEAAAEAAQGLGDALTPQVAKAAAEFGLSLTSKSAERTATDLTTGSLGVLARAANAAAGALAKIAAEEKGDDLVNLALKAFQIGGKGGGKAGGGSLLLGAHHDGAEFGPEIAIFGGWGHVASNDAVQGLAVLSRIARQASGASHGAPRIAVNVRNEAGVPVAADDVQARVAPDGGIDIDILFRRQASKEVLSGNLDGAFRSRFGHRPRRIARS